MLNSEAFENIITISLILGGIIINLLVINGVRNGKALGSKNLKMKIIKKENNEKSFWLNISLQLTLGFISITLGILLFYF